MTGQALGVCYYPEHWPEDWWAEDAEKMRAAGIALVRIGEFAWSRLEPVAGRYEFDWLERSIDVLHAAGLKVVLGTPTATPPKWLVNTMPDMVAVDANGRPRHFGSRRHYDFSHEPYALECDRIVEALARRFGGHPGIVAWQTDNEYGCHDTVESYSPAALQAFRAWCAAKYGTVQALNEAWGNVFWSMELNSFDEAELPNLTVTEANPSHRMDFQRFSSDQVVRFNRRQCEIIRRYSPGRSILHNYMGTFTAFDHYAVSEDLDAASWDSYPLGFLDQSANSEEFKARYLRVGDPDFQAFHHDLYRACGRGRWWVMEQQPGPVNWAPWNPSPAPGAVRLWTHEAFAAGAEVVSYFRWRQAPFAQEQMHEALLLPNSEPNEAYHVAAQVSGELAKLGATVRPERAAVALVFDYESDWAWRIQPQGRDFSYLDLIMRFYRALRRAGVSVDIIPPRPEAVAGRAAVLLPGLFAPTAEFVDALAASGAVTLAGPRSGSKTKDFQIPRDLPPGHLKRLIDLKIRRVESMRPGNPVAVAGSNGGAAFEGWREFVVPGSGTEAALVSADGEVVLARNAGAFYLAGRPNAQLADAVVRRVLDAAGVAALVIHPDIRIRDNGNVRYVFNYGPEAVDVSSLLDGREPLIGDAQLEPCGVLVFNKA
jgi:beta-galactosidase